MVVVRVSEFFFQQKGAACFVACESSDTQGPHWSCEMSFFLLFLVFQLVLSDFFVVDMHVLVSVCMAAMVCVLVTEEADVVDVCVFLRVSNIW